MGIEAVAGRGYKGIEILGYRVVYCAARNAQEVYSSRFLVSPRVNKRDKQVCTPLRATVEKQN